MSPAAGCRRRLCLPLLQDQFLVGLLDEGLEEPALDFQPA